MRSVSTRRTGGRPMIMAPRGVVASGHYLATEIGLEILRRGGNAMDAAAGVGFALAVLKPHQNGIGGEAPMLIHDAARAKVWALSGQGVAPRAATLETCLGYGLEVIPGDGLLPAIVPPAPASWILLLREFGSLRLAEVLAPAVALAAGGFGMYDSLHDSIAAHAGRFAAEWPGSAEVFLPGGAPPPLGGRFRQPAWAATFQRLIDADRRHPDRLDGLRAAHEEFYRGHIAETIGRFCRSTAVRDASGQAHTGLLTAEDLADFQAGIEEPVAATYREVEVFKCGPWTQGPVLLESLLLLEGFDLAAMGHNSADYIHTVTECMKLAFADREFYYGDPKFVPVPLERLLSKDYAAQRRALVDPAGASLDLRPGGLPPVRAAGVGDVNRAFAAASRPPGGDTTKLEVIDSAGNMVSVTPSGGWLMSSPVVPGLGFPLGTRGQMFSLAAGHPNCIAPGKRPRTTLTPSLALRAGRPLMAFGSPGGDAQDQWALQFLLNVLVFDMCLQEAVEAPTFWTDHFPGSFYPRTCRPGSLVLEGRIPPAVREALASRGHAVEVAGDWDGGNTLAAAIDPATGLRHAAASPRLDPAYAAGW